ncbi:MAG: hypothetical protein JNK79_01220 [Chitinophagaceae bacterium]|nr:hypothetical protein [Chitinophagaceae bacterium]
MNKMTTIQKKVDDAMDSILDIRRADPNPFFYTRLQARIKGVESNFWERMSRVVSRPAFAFITLSVVLILNTFVALNETSVAFSKANISDVATADDLGTNAFYDIENVQP